MKQLSGCLTPTELADILGGITIHGVYKALKAHNIESETADNRRKRIPSMGIRKLFTERGFKYPQKNISFQIVKGGVGKTSLSYALGLRASHYGAKVLLIDLDQQGNLTRSFNIDARENPVWLNVIRDNVSIDKAIIELTDTLHILPSNLNNSRLDVELTQSSPNLRDMVKDKLSSVRDIYDLVIFDCPPAINRINLSATCASDMVIIPLNPEPYAMDGLDFTLAELKRIKKEFKLDIDTKIVWNRYDARERLGAVYMHAIAKDEDKYHNVLPVVIRVDASLKNSIFDGKSIFDFTKKTGIRDDFDQFAKEILGINQWSEKHKNTVSREGQ
jgi:chromosome partitioning protein